jgi:arylsulfatase A-like enzyme
VVDEALSWLDRHESKPFFAWIHLFDTHRPYDLPDDYRDRHFDPYLAAIIYVDSQIARLIEHLDARKLLDSTLIVVVGDHGESLGGHGEESHGIFLYQEALRVPFIVSGPGVAPGRPTIARLIDTMPTVLDLFGVPVQDLDGVSLARARRSSGGPSLEVYSESMYPSRYGWAPLRALRADRYKLVDAPRAELYDLTADPMEERNVIADHPAVAAAMLQRVRSIDREQKAPAGAEVDRALAKRLASLGYVAGPGPQGSAAPSAHQPDPKDHIDAYNKLTSLQWQDAHRRRSSCR